MYFKKLFPLSILLLGAQSLSADCASCYNPDACIDKIEYVNYTPWEAGDDAGLWCLPGSRCTESLPTRPSGAEIYQDLSYLSHKNRYPSEYTPEQWRTIMLHMRVILPMTAWNHRMVLSFMQGQQVKGDCSEIASSNSIQKNELALNDDSLKDIGPVSTASELTALTPPGSFSYRSKFNHVFTGTLSFWYFHPIFTFFGDLDGNNSFFYEFDPTFLSSYGDNLLLASKIGVANFGQSAAFFLQYAYVAYVYNDYITFIGGKFFIPFGAYFQQWVYPWIEKSAINPYCRIALGFWDIYMVSDIGFEVKGAIPLCNLGDCFYRSSFTYDLWIGNGPSEVNSFSGSVTSNGSINFSANAPDNNNEIAYGGRIAFLPNDLQSYGISYMRGRWSSNKVAFSVDGLGKKRVYQGAVFDWNIHFHPSILLRGEYLWTQYEGNLSEFKWVRNTCYWAQLALGFDLIEYVCPNLYCWKPCLWDRMEFVIRSEMSWCQPAGRATLGFDYSGFDKKTISFTLGYYFTQSLTAKLQYDINYGDSGLNFVRESITGSSKKTGFDKNWLVFRIAYGW
jgi:hypothetical protein